MTSMKTKDRIEYGDFQTPDDLALAAIRRLFSLGIRARTIIEPTCGKGSFLSAAAELYPDADNLIGIDINEVNLNECRTRLSKRPDPRITLRRADFFTTNWGALLEQYERPWLILGNPPWVTSAALSSIESANLPAKSNFQQRRGIEAVTGKANFDISEWMVLSHLDWLDHRSGTIAILCKVAVARKILAAVWKRRLPVRAAYIFRIDALKHFGAAVDAGFFILDLGPDGRSTICEVYADLDASKPETVIGFVNSVLISDALKFQKNLHFFGEDEHYTWRSGIKHDCSRVMEFSPEGDGYRNGAGELAHIEDTYLYPMMKSSDIGNGSRVPRYLMLVTQRFVGQDTSEIGTIAPLTWSYLQRYAALLEKRGSKIYKNKPPFSIFGVGAYSFAPWKVAISGFYKNLRFGCVGTDSGRPVVFDDTVYFLSCETRDEARFLERILNSQPAREFYESMVFWSEKRPITVELLRRLDLHALSIECGLEQEYTRFTTSRARQRPLERASVGVDRSPTLAFD